MACSYLTSCAPANNSGISRFHSAITTHPNAAMPTTTINPIFQHFDLQQLIPISLLLYRLNSHG